MTSKLDTRLWNLGVGAVMALSACKDPPSRTDDCADASFGGCEDYDYDYEDYDDYDYDYDYDDDCDGYDAEYGCDDPDDYDDYDDYDECDYDPSACDIVCFDDGDCDGGSACLQAGTEAARCEPVVALEACPERLSLTQIPVGSQEAAVSLTFADLDGDDDDELVVVRADRLEVFDGVVIADAIPFEGATAVVAGHFSGETGMDLAVAHGNDVTVFAQAEDGTFSVSATVTVPTGNVVDALPLRPDALSGTSLVTRTDAFQVAILSGDDLSEMTLELGGVIASHVAVGDVDATLGEDIFVEDGGVVSLFRDNGGVPGAESFSVYGVPAVHLAAGTFNAGTGATLVRTFEREGQTVLEPNAFDHAFPLQTLTLAPGRVTFGDLDGDANADVIVTAADRASIVFGSEYGADLRFDCQATHYLGAGRDVIATGDLDGDGRSEVAWGGDNGLVLFSP